MNCCFCNKQISDGLSFCTKCFSPLISCPSCSSYNSPLANYCSFCDSQEFLGNINIAEHRESNTIPMSKILPFYTKISQINDNFAVDPTIEFGYIFLVSTKRLYVLNPRLKVMFSMDIEVNATSGPVITHHIKQSRRKTCNRFIWIPYMNGILRLTINMEYSAEQIALTDPQYIPVNCQTNLLKMGDTVIFGTDRSIVAYGADGIAWELGYSVKNHLVTDGEKIFFATCNSNHWTVYCFNNRGSSLWESPYEFLSSDMSNIYIIKSGRLVFLADKLLHNLDCRGTEHHAPKPTIITQPGLMCVYDEKLYLADPISESIVCLDPLDGNIRTLFNYNRHAFHSKPGGVGSDFVVFADSNLVFIETKNNNPRHSMIKLDINGYPMKPVLFNNAVYLFSDTGDIIRMSRVED